MTATGTCRHCARLRPLKADGTLAAHYIRALGLDHEHRADRQRRRRRLCIGSGQLPRRAEP
jgi:hypothetical protein